MGCSPSIEAALQTAKLGESARFINRITVHHLSFSVASSRIELHLHVFSDQQRNLSRKKLQSLISIHIIHSTFFESFLPMASKILLLMCNCNFLVHRRAASWIDFIQDGCFSTMYFVVSNLLWMHEYWQSFIQYFRFSYPLTYRGCFRSSGRKTFLSQSGTSTAGILQRETSISE